MQSSITTLFVTLLALALFPVVLAAYVWRGCLALVCGAAPTSPAHHGPAGGSADGVVVDLVAYRRQRGLAA